MADERIGVDESGKGDYFGPLVIAACFVGPWHLAELEGVADSKKLTDQKCLALDGKIRATCPHTVVAIGPNKYNDLYAKIGNLNKLLAWGHARAIENVLEKQACNLVISDQFADPRGLQRALMEKGRQVELVSRVRAESDLAVAAASVLARAEFLRRLKSLGEEIGVLLPKGAGPQVDEAARKLVASQGRDVLPRVAKMHFKTTEKVLGSLPGL
ncbi:MAG: ribonuclease HIII [Fimbriimonadaceae bacterium]|jgi:ribonuclease HIII|nr:ribonuclease HIII [Fimbriimonadaceae bacterium]